MKRYFQIRCSQYGDIFKTKYKKFETAERVIRANKSCVGRHYVVEMIFHPIKKKKK